MDEIVIRIQVPKGTQVVTAEHPAAGIAPEQVQRIFPGAQEHSAPVPSTSAQPAPHACPIHQKEMVYHAAGTNRQGKPISASWRCPVPECRGQTIWIEGTNPERAS